MSSILPTADEARRLTKDSLARNAQLTRIALDIRDAAQQGAVQVQAGWPHPAVVNALREAGYMVHPGLNPTTAVISWNHPVTPD